MPRVHVSIPLKAQLGVVLALFVAALVTLWSTSVSVIEREGRRASAKGLLERAGMALDAEGRSILDQSSPLSPFEYVDPEDRRKLDRKLREVAGNVLRTMPGVEGGYFLSDSKQFLGSSRPLGPGEPKKDGDGEGPGPPLPEADLIEIQVHAAMRKMEPRFVVEEVQADAVAIRTAPVIVRGQVIAATWTLTRLADPLFLDRSTRGYRLAAGLALGGMALALGLMVGLTRTVRRQAAERTRLQAELRRSERLAALGKMLAGVAHEVRNPLAGIRSTVQLWQRGIGPDAESFADLVAEADRLEGIVARLLQFTRADAQTLTLGDLNAVVSEVGRLARAQAEAQRVVVELDLDESLPQVLMASPALVQVFRNLTTNALQAMPEGGTLRLSTRRSPRGDSVEASVADTGPGLGLELEHLFEPFYTTKSGGTGLGLAIAREITLAHRGEIRGGAGPNGHGTVFTLSLPAAKGDADGDASDGLG